MSGDRRVVGSERVEQLSGPHAYGLLRKLGALTHAEARVAARAAAGLTNREIAGDVGVSPKTVEWTLTRVYRKLCIRSRTELAICAADNRADHLDRLSARRTKVRRKKASKDAKSAVSRRLRQ
jgi:DNA-binding NarL/FixJ family response regulator